MNMKQFTYILIIIFCLKLSFAKAIASDSLSIKAEKYYAGKNYKAAIESYESLIKQGFSSYKLYYNLGNAYYKNNELGKAIYNYELAHKLEPNNEDININLRIANAKTIDKIESKENFFISVIKSGIVSSLSTTQWAWVSILSLIVALLLIFLYIVSKPLFIRRISFFVSAISLLLFIVSMLLGFSALNQKQQINFGIITERETKIQEEPNAGKASKFSLHEGTKVKVIETNPEWTNIKLENGNEGWVKTSDIGLF